MLFRSGVIVMDLEEGERLVGVGLALAASDRITVETDKGKSKEVRLVEVQGRRGNKGAAIVKRDRFTRVTPPALVVPTLEVS